MKYEDDDKQLHQKELVIDEKVKDRWSRYIRAMGIDAVAKQAVSSVFISGMNGVGIEFGALWGLKRLTLHDDENTPDGRIWQDSFSCSSQTSARTGPRALCKNCSNSTTTVKVDTLQTQNPIVDDLSKLEGYQLGVAC